MNTIAMKARSRLLYATLLALSCIAPAGCQKPVAPIFPERSSPLVWPAPPDIARVRYIGELTGEASLKRRKTGWENLGELVAGPTPTAAFVTPVSVAVQGDLLYVADADARAVYRLDLNNRTLTAIHSAAGERFTRPVDIASSDSRLAVCDSGRASVFLFDLTGRYIGCLSGQLIRPSAVAWSEGDRQWWVVDSGAHACLCFSEGGGLVRSIGSRGSADGEFNFPAGLAVDARGVPIVADSMNFRIQILASDGGPARSFGKKGDAAGDFALPRDVAVDSEGHVYVLDNQFENVQIFDREGRLLMAFGQEGRAPGQFHLPSGITIDRQDRIWIADTYNRRIQVFQYIAETPQ